MKIENELKLFKFFIFLQLEGDQNVNFLLQDINIRES